MGWWERRRLNRRLEAAEYLYKQLRWVDAERELRAVLEVATDGAGSLVCSARTLLAQALRMQGRLQEAESEARSAIAAQPVPGDGRDGQDVLALVLGDMGRHQEAADLLAATAAARARITSSGHRLVLKSRSDRLQHLAYLGLHEEVVAEADAVKTAASGTDDIHRIQCCHWPPPTAWPSASHSTATTSRPNRCCSRCSRRQASKAWADS
ncbi:hypothetical protein GCM10010502_72850 [Kitasatospora aureofaciens]|uniref:Uncharacterized protein n=1 Tax=Kitasatospora aureofaciens TaxID=1894 RepID=A0A8H9I2C8_KITAU|nr:hypothetical protein GCM10010502_72850 [Kitasatospora aureofaciens]